MRFTVHFKEFWFEVACAGLNDVPTSFQINRPILWVEKKTDENKRRNLENFQFILNSYDSDRNLRTIWPIWKVRMSKTENINELVKMLNEIGVLGDKKILKADLLNPSPLFAQEIFYSFLPEFGMSEVILK